MTIAVPNSNLFDFTSFGSDFNFLEIISVRRLHTHHSIPACEVNSVSIVRLEISNLNRILVVVFSLSRKNVVIARAIVTCGCNFDFSCLELEHWLQMLLLGDVDFWGADKLSK